MRQDENRLKRRSVGGLILFSRNYQTKSQVTGLIRAVREINPTLLIAVDQEGGRGAAIFARVFFRSLR